MGFLADLKMTVGDIAQDDKLKRQGYFEGLKSIKKAEILDKNFNIIDLINKNLNNNDYLMIKGSNSTGLHKITNNLKQRSSNVV